jgi:hypothetical protein
MQVSYFVFVDRLSEPMFDISSNVTHSDRSQRGTSTLPFAAYLCGPCRNARPLLYIKQQYKGANLILSHLLKQVILENEYITRYPLHSLQYSL